MATSKSGLPVGTTFAGRFQLEALIGAGPMGEVFRVVEDGKKYALKVFFSRVVPSYFSAAKIKAVYDEKTVVHPSIVRPLEIGEHEGFKYALMPYINGASLREWLKYLQDEEQTGEPRVASLIVDRLCEILGQLPPATVHGAIKPANILVVGLRPDGPIPEDAPFFLTDMGTSHILSFSKYASLQLSAGAPYYYLAPEFVSYGGKVTPQADQFALGVLIYEILTGKTPRKGFKPVSQLNPRVPEEWDDFLNRLMAQKPDQRFESLNEIRHRLTEMVGPLPALGAVKMPVREGPKTIEAKEADWVSNAFDNLLDNAIAQSESIVTGEEKQPSRTTPPPEEIRPPVAPPPTAAPAEEPPAEPPAAEPILPDEFKQVIDEAAGELFGEVSRRPEPAAAPEAGAAVEAAAAELFGESEPADEPAEVAEETVFAEEPAVVEEPAAVEEPAIVEEPEAAEEPAIVEEPEAAEEPAIVEEPEAAEEPAIVEEPAVVEEPIAAEEPAVVDEPVVAEEPAPVEAMPAEPVVEGPVVEEATAAEAPVEAAPGPIVEEPIAAEEPEPIAEEPIVSEEPEPIEEPAAEPEPAEETPAAEAAEEYTLHENQVAEAQAESDLFEKLVEEEKPAEPAAPVEAQPSPATMETGSRVSFDEVVGEAGRAADRPAEPEPAMQVRRPARAKTKSSVGLWATIFGGLLVVAALGFLAHSQGWFGLGGMTPTEPTPVVQAVETPTPEATPEASPEEGSPAANIADLINQANALIDQQKYTKPEDSCALLLLQQIEEMEPSNEFPAEARKKMLADLAKRIEKAMGDENYISAASLAEEGLVIKPDDTAFQKYLADAQKGLDTQSDAKKLAKLAEQLKWYMAKKIYVQPIGACALSTAEQMEKIQADNPDAAKARKDIVNLKIKETESYLAAKKWDEAIATAGEGLKAETKNAKLLNLKNQALAGKQAEVAEPVTPTPSVVVSKCPDGMRYVGGGSVRMGSAPDDPLHKPGEKNNTPTYVAAYCIDLYEFPNQPGSPPKTNVGWAEAKKSCEAQGKRLCSEAEWERSCKGPANSRFPYGNDFNPNVCATQNSNGQKRTVASAGGWAACRSGFGVYDMSGNVREWTSSPVAPGQAAYVVKGGAADEPDWAVRCGVRIAAGPGTASYLIGFRCCGSPNE
ncbi:MAG: SUMF1/EgtB/PvdO family nonheme iron enzyme [Myxococcales bacterium]|nr:SUMF1/EgtB/PvdO family nonheme iron enzyme [Myxococcales bacterium]